MILQHIMRRWNDIIDRWLISESRSLYLVPDNWWKNQVHCQYTKIKIIISLFLKFLESYQWSVFNFFYRRFEFEPQNSGGACVDYVNFYDGTYTSGSLINTNRYCGSTTPTNITSTGTTLTVEMITDNSAIYRGFDLLLSAYSDGMDVMFLIIEQAYWYTVGWFGFMVFNDTFNNISVILWGSVLLMEETWGPRENHWPAASHWQTSSHNVVFLALSGSRTHNIRVIGTDYIGSYESNYHAITATTAPIDIREKICWWFLSIIIIQVVYEFFCSSLPKNISTMDIVQTLSQITHVSHYFVIWHCFR